MPVQLPFYWTPFFGLPNSVRALPVSIMEGVDLCDSVMENVIQASAYSTIVEDVAGSMAAQYRMELVHEHLLQEVRKKITEEQKQKWYNALHRTAFEDPNDDNDTKAARADRWMKGCQSFMIDFDVHLAAFQCLCSLELKERQEMLGGAQGKGRHLEEHWKTAVVPALERCLYDLLHVVLERDNEKEVELYAGKLRTERRSVTKENPQFGSEILMRLLTGQSKFNSQLFYPAVLPNHQQRCMILAKAFEGKLDIDMQNKIMENDLINAHHTIMDPFLTEPSQSTKQRINRDFVVPMLESLFDMGHINRLYEHFMEINDWEQAKAAMEKEYDGTNREALGHMPIFSCAGFFDPEKKMQFEDDEDKNLPSHFTVGVSYWFSKDFQDAYDKELNSKPQMRGKEGREWAYIRVESLLGRHLFAIGGNKTSCYAYMSAKRTGKYAKKVLEIAVFLDQLIVQCQRQALHSLWLSDSSKYGSGLYIASSAPTVGYSSTNSTTDCMGKHGDDDPFCTTLQKEKPFVVGLPSKGSFRVYTAVTVSKGKEDSEKAKSTLEYYTKNGKKMRKKLYGKKKRPFEVSVGGHIALDGANMDDKEHIPDMINGGCQEIARYAFTMRRYVPFGDVERQKSPSLEISDGGIRLLPLCPTFRERAQQAGMTYEEVKEYCKVPGGVMEALVNKTFDNSTLEPIADDDVSCASEQEDQPAIISHQTEVAKAMNPNTWTMRFASGKEGFGRYRSLFQYDKVKDIPADVYMQHGIDVGDGKVKLNVPVADVASKCNVVREHLLKKHPVITTRRAKAEDDPSPVVAMKNKKLVMLPACWVQEKVVAGESGKKQSKKARAHPLCAKDLNLVRKAALFISKYYKNHCFSLLENVEWALRLRASNFIYSKELDEAKLQHEGFLAIFGSSGMHLRAGGEPPDLEQQGEDPEKTGYNLVLFDGQSILGPTNATIATMMQKGVPISVYVDLKRVLADVTYSELEPFEHLTKFKKEMDAKKRSKEPFHEGEIMFLSEMSPVTMAMVGNQTLEKMLSPQKCQKQDLPAEEESEGVPDGDQDDQEEEPRDDDDDEDASAEDAQMEDAPAVDATAADAQMVKNTAAVNVQAAEDAPAKDAQTEDAQMKEAESKFPTKECMKKGFRLDIEDAQMKETESKLPIEECMQKEFLLDLARKDIKTMALVELLLEREMGSAEADFDAIIRLQPFTRKSFEDCMGDKEKLRNYLDIFNQARQSLFESHSALAVFKPPNNMLLVEWLQQGDRYRDRKLNQTYHHGNQDLIRHGEMLPSLTGRKQLID